MTLGKRLKTLRVERGLSQRELGRLMGLNHATISSYERSVSHPNNEILTNLADYFVVPADYLLGRTDNPNYEDNPSAHRHNSLGVIRFNKGVKSVVPIATKQLPILGRIKAGVPLLSDQHIIGEIEVPESIAGQAQFALEVSGDSMIGAGLQAGDYVFMRTAERKPPGHGDIVAAMIDHGDMTLKRYLKQNGHYCLHAENPQYPDIVVDRRVTIQGVYVGRFSEYAGTVDPPIDDMSEDELVTKLAKMRGLDPDQVSGMLDVLGKKRQ